MFPAKGESFPDESEMFQSLSENCRPEPENHPTKVNVAAEMAKNVPVVLEDVPVVADAVPQLAEVFSSSFFISQRDFVIQPKVVPQMRNYLGDM